MALDGGIPSFAGDAPKSCVEVECNKDRLQRHCLHDVTRHLVTTFAPAPVLQPSDASVHRV